MKIVIQNMFLSWMEVQMMRIQDILMRIVLADIADVYEDVWPLD